MKKPSKKMKDGGYTPLFKRPKPSTGATPTQTKEGYKPLVNKVKDRVKESVKSIGSDTGYKPLIRRTKPSTGATPTGSKKGYTPLIDRSGSRSEKPSTTSVKKNDDLEGYRKAFKDNYNKNTSSPTPAKTEEKKGGSGGGKKAATSTTKVTKSASSKPGLRAKVPISLSRVSSNLSIPKRKTIDVTYTPKQESKPSTQKERSYSKTEKKMIPLAEKVKKGENVAASQMKLKALQDKRRAEKMRAERKENRTAKKSNRTEKRSAVKAVKKSYKK
jgi:hypothetical protein